MTTQEAKYLYDNLNLDRSFKYDVVIIDHVKENLKYKTNIRTTIYYNEENIFSYDSFIAGRKNIITNPIKNDQFIIVFDKIIESIKSNTTYKNILVNSKIIDSKRIEIKKRLLDILYTVYHGWRDSDNYEIDLDVKFPDHRRFVENINSIENMFHKFQIKVICKNKYDVIQPNTGSIVLNRIANEKIWYELRTDFLNLLEDFSKVIKREVKDFSYWLLKGVDLEVIAHF
jgi:hypothetical protein